MNVSFGILLCITWCFASLVLTLRTKSMNFWLLVVLLE